MQTIPTIHTHRKSYGWNECYRGQRPHISDDTSSIFHWGVLNNSQLPGRDTSNQIWMDRNSIGNAFEAMCWQVENHLSTSLNSITNSVKKVSFSETGGSQKLSTIPGIIHEIIHKNVPNTTLKHPTISNHQVYQLIRNKEKKYEEMVNKHMKSFQLSPGNRIYTKSIRNRKMQPLFDRIFTIIHISKDKTRLQVTDDSPQKWCNIKNVKVHGCLKEETGKM